MTPHEFNALPGVDRQLRQGIIAMRIIRRLITSMILPGIVVGAAIPADAAAFHGGCCEGHRARLSARNANPHRQQSRIRVINRLQVNNISRSDSNPVQRIEDGRFGVSSSAAAAGGGGADGPTRIGAR